MSEQDPDCAWCGGECFDDVEYKNEGGEVFCSRYHRDASNQALRDFETAQERGDKLTRSERTWLVSLCKRPGQRSHGQRSAMACRMRARGLLRSTHEVPAYAKGWGPRSPGWKKLLKRVWYPTEHGRSVLAELEKQS